MANYMPLIEQEKPTEAHIRQTIVEVKKKLANPLIDKPVNRPVKEGFTEVLNILVEGRETYEGIEKLSTVQARAIAELAVDYLRGDETRKMLVGVPLKP